MQFQTPTGMTRRHFAKHLLGASAFAGSALALGRTLSANVTELKRNNKSAILLWMGGGPFYDRFVGLETGGRRPAVPFQKLPLPDRLESVNICR